MARDASGEAAFRAEARAWLEAHARRRTGVDDWSDGPAVHTPEAEAEHFARCRDWQRTLYDGGWAGIRYPRAWGGRDGTLAQELLFAEEQSAFDVTTGFLGASIALVAPALLDSGTPAQRERYLRPLLRGDEAWCQLFSEPEAGSDLANLATRAERHGDHFAVNGQKLWTSSAQHCEFGILLARTNPDAPKHRGISFFLLDLRSPGIDVRPLRTSAGTAHFNEVFLTDVRVPAGNVVGEVDGGWAVARSTLAAESMMIGTLAGRGDDAAELVALARERGLGADPRVRQELARVYADWRIAGFMRERMRDAVREGRAPDLDGSVLKVYRSECEVSKNELALRLLGADALLDGPDAPAGGAWQTAVLSAPLHTIGGGTLEVHRNGIGERALGLPREPRVDRDRSYRELRVTR